MGIFGSVFDAISEANDAARSDMLHRDLFETMQAIGDLPNNLREETATLFIGLRLSLLEEIRNWSREGVLSMAKRFFAEAKKEYDFNKSKGLGLRLGGIWLESMVRSHPKAEEAHQLLENLVIDLTTPNLIDKTAYQITKEATPHINPNAIISDQFPGIPKKIDFGFDIRNPIPCDAETGAEPYLKRLRWCGQPINFSKIKTHTRDNFTGFPIEEYTITPLVEKRSWRLYFSPYQMHTSDRAPEFFTLASCAATADTSSTGH